MMDLQALSLEASRVKDRAPQPIEAPVTPNVGVFARGQSTRSLPVENIPREQAQELVDTKFARWVSNRYNSIQMTREPATLKMRGDSCQMGPRITFAALLGSESAIVCVNAWRNAA